MDRDFLIKVCLGVYKVTELFPDNEPLRTDIRKKANQILADSVLVFNKNPESLTKEEKEKIQSQIFSNIEVLKGYFEVAKGQNWVDERNFFVLEKEYAKIEEELSKSKEKKVGVKKRERRNFLSASLTKRREEKILEILRQKERVQIREIKGIFPDITKRTLRRDFERLVRKGLIQRIGKGKWSAYSLIGHQSDINRTSIGQRMSA